MNPRKKFMIVSNDAKSIVNFRLDLLLKLKTKGYEIHIVAPYIINSEYSSFLNTLDFKIYDLDLSRIGVNPIKELKTLYCLFRIIKKVEPLHFLGYTIKPCIYGVILSKLAGVKNKHMLITGLGYIFSNYIERNKPKFSFKNVIFLLYWFACYFADTIIFQNSDDPLLFKELGIINNFKKVHVVNGSGVNLQSFKRVPLVSNNSTCIPNFLMIARLLKDKGIYEYIEAIKMIKKIFPNVQFGLLGAIDLNPLSVTTKELEMWIKEGLITYYGYTNNVQDIIEKYNVIVLPSYREGVPRAILEGMAMGRAVITTNSPGCKETIVDGVNGYIVEVKSAYSLYLSFLKIIENPNLIKSMSEESFSLIKEKFDVNIVNKDMIKIMEV